MGSIGLARAVARVRSSVPPSLSAKASAAAAAALVSVPFFHNPTPSSKRTLSAESLTGGISPTLQEAVDRACTPNQVPPGRLTILSNHTAVFNGRTLERVDGGLDEIVAAAASEEYDCVCVGEGVEGIQTSAQSCIA
mmetsp:Transcript_22030/g.61139  ORF Transcript_22030/g.61139 Transcript_22030/m.61139 type:complete len:137 (-) Transcript_22030:454-864(-)